MNVFILLIIFIQLPFNRSFLQLDNFFSPPPQSRRLHCILTTHPPQTGRNSSDNRQELTYTLKYEHFGSYITLLKAVKKPAGGFQSVRFSIMPGESRKMRKSKEGVANGCTSHRGNRERANSFASHHHQDGNNATTSSWASTPSSSVHLRQQQRNSWSGGSSSKIDRFKRAVSRLRPRSAALVDASLDEGMGHDWLQQDGPVGDIKPTSTAEIAHGSAIAELSGNRLLNKYRISGCSPGEGNSANLIGLIDINSHHISCEPRDIDISLFHEDEAHPFAVLSSKRPEWNATFNVYELDFGGRISRDSVKNLQVELNGKIVSYL